MIERTICLLNIILYRGRTETGYIYPVKIYSSSTKCPAENSVRRSLQPPLLDDCQMTTSENVHVSNHRRSTIICRNFIFSWKLPALNIFFSLFSVSAAISTGRTKSMPRDDGDCGDNSSSKIYLPLLFGNELLPFLFFCFVFFPHVISSHFTLELNRCVDITWIKLYQAKQIDVFYYRL